MEQVFETHFDPENPQKAAAKILGLIAEPDDQIKQRQFEFAAAALWIRHRARRDPDWAFDPQVFSPVIALIEQKEAEKALGKLISKICTHRLPAADIAGTLLAQGALESFDPEQLGRVISQQLEVPLDRAKIKISVAVEEFDPKSQATITRSHRPSVNKLAEQVAWELNRVRKGWAPREARGWNRENVISRIWTPAKPIIHLILALRPVIKSVSIAGEFDPMDLFGTRWVEHFALRAEAYRKSIAASEKLRISEANMIPLRLVPERRAEC